MGFKTTSTRFTQARSAQSSDLVAFNNATSGGPSISGTSLTPTSAVTTVTATPGQSAASSTTTAGGVLISNVIYTNSAYATLSANAAATTYGTFRIIGSGFAIGANVFLSNTAAGTISNITSNTTYISTGEIRANANVTAGFYSLLVTNPTGGAAIYYSGMAFEPYPLWTTTAVSFNGSTISGNVATYVTSTAIEQPITFALAAGNTLPSGLTLFANGAILGTVTQSNSTQTYFANINATDLFNETTTANVSLTINLLDPSFNYTTLLLNGETTTTTYITDVSTTNANISVVGAAVSNRFSPLWGAGYYGVNFNGATGSQTALTTTTPAIGTGNFTLEFWIYYAGSTTYDFIATDQGATGFALDLDIATGKLYPYDRIGGSAIIAIASINTTLPIGQWVHVAAVRSSTGAGGFTMYQNGVATGSGQYSGNITSTALTIGSRYAISTYWYGVNGNISNLRLLIGTALYTTTFTPPTAPLTAIANTALLTCQNASFVDNSSNNYAITQVGAAKVVANQPFGVLPGGVQTYGSSSFDGSTGYLTLPGTPYVFGTNPFTVECWVYPTISFSGGPVIIDNFVTGASYTTGQWQIEYGTSGQVNFTVATGTSTVQTITTSTNTVLNAWTHIAVVRTGTGTNQTAIYINGVSSATGTYSQSIGINSPSSIGRQTWSNNTYYQGYISNLRTVVGTAVYTTNFTPPTAPLTAVANTALLTLQYKNGHNNNTFYDDSVNNFAVTRNGTPTQGTFSPFSQTGWSNWFDGSTGYFSSASINLSAATAFTIEAWVFWNGATASGTVLQKDGRFGTNYSSYGFGLNGSGYITASIGSGNGVSYNQNITSSTALPTNQWVHVAFVYSSNVLTLYQNGVSVASATKTGSMVDGSQGVSLGYSPGQPSSAYWSGYISNARIVNGTAVYTSTFTPSTTPLTAIANTALLTCQSNRFVDNSTNAYALSITGTVQVQALSPFAPGANYSASTNGAAMYFNGSTDYLSMPSNGAFNLGTSNFTIECWVYSTTAGVAQYFSGQANSTATTTSWSVGTAKGSGNNLGLTVISGTTVYDVPTTGTTIPLNAWVHYVGVRDGTTLRVYINGVQAGSLSIGSASINASTNQFAIGRLGEYTSSYFSGYVANYRLINGVCLYPSGTSFTPPTAPPAPTQNTGLLLLGTNTGIQDATGKNDIITVGSAKTQSSIVKYGTSAMSFNGSSDYLTSPYSVLYALESVDFTIEAWVYRNSTGSEHNIALTRSSAGSDGWGFRINSTNTLQFFYTAGGSVTTTGTIPATTWTHVAATRVGTLVRLFINGTLDTSGTASANAASTQPLRIGVDNTNAAGFFNGYIDELRITKGVARYTANFTPPTVAFLTQ